MTGTIQLANDVSIGGGGITLSGQVSDLGAGHNLTRIGAGPLTLSNAAGNIAE